MPEFHVTSCQRCKHKKETYSKILGKLSYKNVMKVCTLGDLPTPLSLAIEECNLIYQLSTFTAYLKTDSPKWGCELKRKFQNFFPHIEQFLISGLVFDLKLSKI